MMDDIDMWLSLKDNARFDPLVVRRDVLWLGLGSKGAKERFRLRTAAGEYGNEPTTDTVYSGVALLLQVPAWGTPQRNAAMAPGQRRAPDMETD
ncbi:hypothetical protein GPECTOR_1094g368 [Gonium pectorale]|uniref:Uncharacterized protein n=1 Tax=Gonium pectorale TaxID=33097 RepID=A0A150FTN4_GONPE|nr:hypothetical protein GPECTOR_1094g368 [Gonium pectorale]|eukprot:KXZ40969.1 hypothetical protein GPECTOR_1094g368 [Gonium pectorale]